MQRRPDAPSPTLGVQVAARRDGDYAHAGDQRLLADVPLAACQVRDLVPGGRQALGEVAIPALGATDCPWIQAVVDDADPHAAYPLRAVATAVEAMTERKRRISVVIPCLNEAATIAECVTRVRAVLEDGDLEGDVIVVDNGSVDGSGDIASAAGATVVREPRRGYGSAYSPACKPQAATTS